MKNIMKFSAAMVMALGMASCIQEFDPQSNYVSEAEVNNAPGTFKSAVTACTNSLTGELIYGPNSTNPWNFGLPSLYLQHDIMGQDLIPGYLTGSEWYTGWYQVNTYVSSESGTGSRLPWEFCYRWINSCNKVIFLGGDNPTPEQYGGMGIAYAVRAMCYLELGQTFGKGSYAQDKNALTVPVVTEATTMEDETNNPRVSYAELFALIKSDLDNAEKYLASYKRPDKTTPDLNTAYGLKARLYLLMEDWANAKLYAEKAMEGYTMLAPNEICDFEEGFNSPNHAWMWCMTHAATDPCIKQNDADTSWGSQMINEAGLSGCGYSPNYVGPKRIDKHLFESIPYTDARKNLWVDFKLDEMDEPAMREALLTYTPNADNLQYNNWYNTSVGGVPVKFRPAKGSAVNGTYPDQYAAFTVSIPIMRVEEMMLIQAEAAGRINEAEGIALLTKFAQQRDPQYTYGMHKVDADTGCGMSDFMKEIWWQRRVELWAEGFAMFDIKRLNAAIVRNYPGTNHLEGFRFNTSVQPFWMDMLITSYEASYNSAIVQNPLIVAPEVDSPEYTLWK